MHTDANHRNRAPKKAGLLRSYPALGVAFALGFVAMPLVILALSSATSSMQVPAAVDYAKALADAPHEQLCRARPAHESFQTDDGLRINVRAPANYDRERAHPLLVVFPPGGYGRLASESFYSLTAGATARGFVVAYADGRPLSKSMIALYSKVSEAVAGQWCIDPKRVAFLGHSDGASAAYGIALLQRSAPQPSAMLLSGAGLSGGDLQSEACPAAQSIMVVHGQRDALFPGFGRQASSWWAKCFGCDAGKHTKVSSDCVEVVGCRQGSRLVFCAPDAAHVTAPVIGSFELDFLQQEVKQNNKKE